MWRKLLAVLLIIILFPLFFILGILMGLFQVCELIMEVYYNVATKNKTGTQS